MTTRAKMAVVVWVGLGVLLSLPPVPAQTNAGPAATAVPPPLTPLERALIPLTNAISLTATNLESSNPAAPPDMAEADRFFNTYGQALQFLRLGSQQQAFVVMDVLAKKLQTSPWIEIALLKKSELDESVNDASALEGFDSVLRRLATAPYYQGTAQRARLFSASLQGAAERGIARVRLARVRTGLGRYFARYLQYPESLAKLAIFNYIDMQDITDANRRPFRYIPTGLQFRPTMSYQRYELESLPGEPFAARAPRLDSTTRISENPDRYAALIHVPGRADPARVTEDQTIEGFFVGAIAPGGAVVVANNRVLVLPVPR